MCFICYKNALTWEYKKGKKMDQPYTHAEFEFGSRGAVALVLFGMGKYINVNVPVTHKSKESLRNHFDHQRGNSVM